MRLNYRPPSGKCFICGRSTKVGNHTACSKQAERDHKITTGKKTAKQYSQEFINLLTHFD